MDCVNKFFLIVLYVLTQVKANGAPFVYQCTELVDNNDVETKEIVNYCVEAIKASGLKWGPTHTEVKMTKDGPRLIEINCR